MGEKSKIAALLFFFVFLWSTYSVAQIETVLEKESTAAFSSLQDVMDLIARTPLTDENNFDNSKHIPVDNLIGKKIEKIVADDSPLGFSPVDDAKIPLGATLSKVLSRELILNLWETGNYSEITIYGELTLKDTLIIHIHVTPMFRISKMNITGNKVIESSEIKRAIRYIPGRSITPDEDTLLKLKEAIIAEYNKRGYPDADASLKLETTDVPGQLLLSATIDEGKSEKYEIITLSGLPDELNEEKILRQAGLKNGIIRDESHVREGIDSLSDIFFELGYPDIKILDNYSSVRIDRYRLKLIITVIPGLKTEIDFFGNNRLRKRDLHELIYIRYHFNTTENVLKSAVKKIRQFAISNGLLHAKVNFVKQCHQSDKRWYTISPQNQCGKNIKFQKIIFTLDEGLPVEIENIYFSGNHFFTSSKLKEELFAYVLEKYKTNDVIQFPLKSSLYTTQTSSVESFKKINTDSLHQDKMRNYDPALYEEASVHLEDLYKEQGFLNVTVTDKCNIKDEPAFSYNNITYRPFTNINTNKEPGAPSPCVLINSDQTKIIAKLTVIEGIQTIVRNIFIKGNNSQNFPDSLILKKGDISVGQNYNEYQIRTGIKKIADYYLDKGYMFSQVAWNTSISQDSKTADINLTIYEGPKVFADKIIINAEHTNKKFILDNVGFKEGEVISPDKLQKAHQNLMALGVFTGVTVQLQSPATVNDKKNIIITVIERKPQYLELSAGAATEKGIRGGFEYGHKNVFGLAVNFRLKMRANFRPQFWFIGPDGQAFKQDLIERYATYEGQTIADAFKWIEWYVLMGLRTSNIPGTKGKLGTGIDVSFENVNRRGYSAMSVKPYYRLRIDFLKHLPISLNTGIEGTLVIPSQNVGEISSEGWYKYSRLPSGKAVFFVNSLKIELDYRDNPMDTRKGFLASVEGDFVKSLFTENQKADVIEQSQYIKSLSTISGYIPFNEKKNVIALSASVGYIFHLKLNSIAWADRQFYMGGVATLRGFSSDALVPQDIYGADWRESTKSYNPEKTKDVLDEDGNPTGETKYIEEFGGQAMFLVRAELRHDFGANLMGIIFGEAGNLWRDEKLFLKQTNGKLNPLLLRPVAGVGLHYNTPVGPLAFDVGFNLNKRQHESSWAWYFSVGSAF
ncbi:MAG: BamA/TamA family outer membrane protein [Deltaproteobacteria bacterium]|nr:BamA/TamA family outer membrane protein [Deltaproteobacteria bacterium]